MLHCATPPTLALLLFLQFLFWLEIVLDYFNTFSLYPVGSQFQVGRITLVNTFPFGTKLQSHSPVKESLDKKIVSSTLPHLTAHLSLNTPSSQFPPCFVPTIPSSSFWFRTVNMKYGLTSKGKSNPLWLEVGNEVLFNIV